MKSLCDSCIKKSVCKLCDGSLIRGCIEFSKGEDMLRNAFMENFSKQLNKLMKATGMTQRELSRRLNVSNSTVSRWVRGEVDAIYSDLLFGLCDIFQVDPMYFTEKTE